MKTQKILAVLCIGTLILSNLHVPAFARNGNWNGNTWRDDDWWDSDDRWRSRWNAVNFNRNNNSWANITPRQVQSRVEQVLSKKDQDTINRSIDRVPLIRRLDYLLWVLSRIETLRTTVENSSRTTATKERIITLLDAIVEIIQNRINSEISWWSENDDNTPPKTSSFWVSQISTNSALVSVTSNEAGTGYFVILPSSFDTPSPPQVRSWQTDSGTAAMMSGSSAIVKGLNQFSITGLSPNFAYTVHFIAEDTFENLQNNVKSRLFMTLPTWSGADTTPPIISGVSLTGVTNTGVSLQLNSNESWIIYGVSLLSGSIAPTPAQVKAWQNASGSLSSLYGTFNIITGSNQWNLSGFSPDTGYDLYLVAQDALGNLQNSVTKVSFKTLSTIITDTTPPVITGLMLTGVTNNNAVLELTSNEPWILYTVTLLSGSTAPSLLQVKAWQNASGSVASIHNAFTIGLGWNQWNLSGFTGATNYTLYLVAEDTYLNTEPMLHTLNFSTP